jgi:hypothetical protein
MQITLGRAYLGCLYLTFTQSVHVPYLWDQLGFLVTKILGDDSHSLIPLIKNKNFLSPHICQIHTWRGISPWCRTRVTAFTTRKSINTNGNTEGIFLSVNFRGILSTNIFPRYRPRELQWEKKLKQSKNKMMTCCCEIFFHTRSIFSWFIYRIFKFLAIATLFFSYEFF